MCQKHKSFLFATLVILFIQFFCLFFANHTYSSTIIRGEFLAIWTVWAIWTVEKSNRKIRNAALVIEIPIWRTVSGIEPEIIVSRLQNWLFDLQIQDPRPIDGQWVVSSVDHFEMLMKKVQSASTINALSEYAIFSIQQRK